MVSTVRAFNARDLSGQHWDRFSAPVDMRIGDLTGSVLERLGLPERDPNGAALAYRWRNDSRNVLLDEAQVLGQAVEEEDDVILMGEPIAG